MSHSKRIFTPMIRNIEAGVLFENFFIFSVLSIFVIRVYLELADYPQLGGTNIHIAHMLWGGLFMLAALLLFFIFLNKSVHQIASILAGIGFGTFIDELGKFITSNNNYFYQPTFALIYSIFIILYLFFQVFVRRSRYTPMEYLANALEETKEVVIHDFDIEEKRRALAWLSRADQRNSYTKVLKQLILEQKPEPVKPALYNTVRKALARWYLAFISSRWIIRLSIGFFTLQVLIYVICLALLVIFRSTVKGWVINYDVGFFGWGLIISVTIAMLLLLYGVVQFFRFSRLLAYEYFRLYLLISIFVITFFIFYYNQLIAIGELILSIIFLKALEYGQNQEHKLKTLLLHKK